MNERLENIRVIEDAVIEGETISMENYEIEVIDWDKRLKEHKEELEREFLERENRLKRQEEKSKSWELYRTCRDFLENNDSNWENKKIERIREQKRIERLDDARKQQTNIREKVRERMVDEKINDRMNQLPIAERKKLEQEQDRKERLELKETCTNLWKLRSRERKFSKEHEKLTRLQRIEKKKKNLK